MKLPKYPFILTSSFQGIVEGYLALRSVDGEVGLLPLADTRVLQAKVFMAIGCIDAKHIAPAVDLDVPAFRTTLAKAVRQLAVDAKLVMQRQEVLPPAVPKPQWLADRAVELRAEAERELQEAKNLAKSYRKQARAMERQAKAARALEVKA